MFYLMNFYRILLGTPLKSLVFVVMAWGIVFGLAHNKTLEKSLFQEVQDERDYFYALISHKKNANDISRKLQDLPGIELVKNVSQNVIQQELVRVLKHSNLSEYVEDSLGQLDYNGLKIIFSSNIKEQSQNLIRDYLFRLVGKKDLTLGPVQKKPTSILKKQRPFMFFKKYGVLFLMGVGVLIWTLLGISYAGAFYDNTYVIESFQRRSGVSFKTALLGMTSLFVTGSCVALISGGIDGNGMLMAVLPFLFMVLWHTRAGRWQH